MKRIENIKLSTIFISILVILLAFIITYKFSYSQQVSDVLAYLPTSHEINSERLVSGRFNVNREIESNNSYMSLNYLVLMKEESFRATLPNEFIRMEITELDENYKYVDSADIAHLDYFTKNSKTKYLLLSFYKMNEYGNLVDSTYEELFNLFENKEFEFKELKDMNTEENASIQSEITTYLSSKTFLNVGNYKMGQHNSGWNSGTKFTYNTSSMSSRNYYKVVPGSKLYVSSNDSRYNIHISWRDKTGKWIKSAYDWKGGVGFNSVTVPDNAYAMSINLDSKEKKVNAASLVLDLETRVALSYEDYYYSRTPKQERNIVINDINEWRTGNYGYTGNEYYNSLLSYASKYYYKNSYGNTRMQYKVNNEDYSLKVIEIDSNYGQVKSTTLTADKTFTFNSNTAYYALVVENRRGENDSKRVDFIDALQNGLEISFSPYIKYKHNTVMNDVTNRDITSKLTTGWNLGNTFESHNSKFVESSSYWDVESYWGNPYVTENLIKYVKSLGFNNIRIPISYINNFYIDKYGNYLIREEVLQRVSEIIDYALKQDMYIVINTHFDSGMSASPIKVGQENLDFERAAKYSKQVWTQVAEYFKDYDEHLMFESYNEVDNPYDSRICTSIAAAQMNELNQIFVDAVRNTGGNNEKRILQVQTFLSTTSTSALDGFEVPKDIYPDKLIAHVHSYPNSWDQKIEETLIRLDELTNRTGLPIVVGEFGTRNNFSPSTFRYTVVSNFIARCKNHNIVVYIWDNGSDFAVINRKDLTSNKKYVDAIFNAKEYFTDGKIIINEYEKFVCGKLNQGTGEITNKYDGWGTILSELIDVPSDSKFLQIDLINRNDAESRNLHYIFFYDENKKFLKDKSINEGYPGFTSKFIVVPKEAKYVMFGINSSTKKTRVEDYKRYFAEGNMYIEYKFLDIDIDRTLLDTPLEKNEVMFGDFYDFEWGMLYTGNGVVKVNIGWGEISTPYIELADNQKTFDYRFLTRASAKISVRHLVFYDKDKNYLAKGIDDSSQSGRNSASLEIPEGAKYVRVGITGLSNFKRPEYNMMFATGDAVFIYKKG